MTSENIANRPGVEQGGTDVAALAASILAVVLSLSNDARPYDLMSVATALTLIAIITAYIRPHARPKREMSFAYAAALSLSCIPVTGYLAELIVSHSYSTQDMLHMLSCDILNCEDLVTASYVATGFGAISWVVGIVIIYPLDRRRQRVSDSIADEESADQ